VAILAEWAGADGLGDGIRLGLVVGIGLVMSLVGVTAFFEPTKKSKLAWGVITAGYHFVGVVVVALIVASWLEL
jgi:hypothetical protein